MYDEGRSAGFELAERVTGEILRHSYEKFRFAGGVNKSPFDEIYRAVKSYIKTVLPYV